jgi:hypothetical protein
MHGSDGDLDRIVTSLAQPLIALRDRMMMLKPAARVEPAPAARSEATPRADSVCHNYNIEEIVDKAAINQACGAV